MIKCGETLVKLIYLERKLQGESGIKNHKIWIKIGGEEHLNL